MKVVQINSVCGSGSTGKICEAISRLLTKTGIENYILYAYDGSDYQLGIQYMTTQQVKRQAIRAKIAGNYGFQSRTATERLIAKLEEISPDIVQLHNIHGHNVHLKKLFTYLKRKNVKVYWTFHDCFAFTAYCMYFDYVQCEKWKIGCKRCPQVRKYSWLLDRSRTLYRTKKELLKGLDLTIITPSHWLAALTKQSFLQNYPVEVIHNGIDLSVFSPRNSDFREKMGIKNDSIVLLGVANRWEHRKGLDVFIRLAQELDNDRFRIVLVGTNEVIDKCLPENIISLHRTANQIELAEVYSAADYFVNPTREDNFPTVNIEALACGTPVITFEIGGSTEMLNEKCGIGIKRNDFGKMLEVINSLSRTSFLETDCVKRAAEFSQDGKFKEYIDLYCRVNQ